MRAIHPSNIKMAEKYCQYAIKLLEDNVPYDRDVFQTGVAAHYMLEHLGKEANKLKRNLMYSELESHIERLSKEMITKPRTYDGRDEPPIPLMAIYEAKEMVMEWATKNEIHHDAHYEMPFALDKDWNSCDYNDPSAIFRTIIDVVRVYTDNSGKRIAHVRDYKSSYYIRGLMEDLQRKAQAIVVWEKFHPDEIILDVTSIRTGQSITKNIPVTGNTAQLHEWSDYIKLACQELTNVNSLRPQPGPNCYGCPYARSCKHAVIHANKSDNVVHKYVAALSVAKSLEKEVKAITKDKAVTQGDTIVGYVTKEHKSLERNATIELLNAAIEAGWDIYSFIDYMSITRSQADKIYRDLPPELRNKIKHLFIKKTSTKFGVHK